MTDLLNIATACVDEPASSHPDKIALIFDRGPAEPSDTLSYGQLASASDQFAALLQQASIRPGERVVLNLGNCSAFPIVFFGCLKAGVIAVPTSALLVDEELQFILQDCAARGLITNKARPDISTSNPQLWSLDAEAVTQQCRSVAAKETPLGRPKVSRNEPAYLVYTSGTTGQPKGVLHGHRSLTGRAPAATAWFDFEIDQRLLHTGQMNWTYVLGSGLMDPLLHGKTVILRESPAAPDCWPEMITRHQATTLIAVPTLYRQILRHTQADRTALPSLRHCMSAGEALAETIREQWQERFQLPIYEAVGMSECSYYLSQPPHQPLVPGSCGVIQPGHQVALLDDQLQPIPAGEPGMLCISEKDPGLFLRYWESANGGPQQNSQNRQQGWFLTGDYGQLDSAGNLRFLGRKDDQINTLGYRVSPYEVERVFRSHPDIEECICLGQALEEGKTLLALAVIPMAGASLSTAALLSYGEAHLARYKQPRFIHFVQQFPRTANGKVQRKQLALDLAGR